MRVYALIKGYWRLWVLGFGMFGLVLGWWCSAQYLDLGLWKYVVSGEAVFAIQGQVFGLRASVGAAGLGG